VERRGGCGCLRGVLDERVLARGGGGRQGEVRLRLEPQAVDHQANDGPRL